ncbi:MAG: YceI family protein [Flavobacteriales bacterium]
MAKTVLTIMAIFAISLTAFSQKLVTSKSNIKFFSHTVAEDISANNTKAVGTLNTETGEVVFSVPMQGFEFEKALMQKHYNSPKFLDTKQFPKAKLVGKIANLTSVNFKKDGTYPVTVKGEMDLHGVTKSFEEKATITVKGEIVTVNSKFNIALADYKIAFEKGKPSTNIAKTIETTIDATF